MYLVRYHTTTSSVSLHANIHIIEPYPVKTGLNASAKSFDSCQPAQSAQADMNRIVFETGPFSACRRTIPHYESVG